MSSLYEIVELPNGEIALQRTDDAGEKAGEPLVSIRFSEESLYFLNGAQLDVAKAMIEAGLEVAGDIEESGGSEGSEEGSDAGAGTEWDSNASHTLH
jgi:hypothetical protein